MVWKCTAWLGWSKLLVFTKKCTCFGNIFSRSGGPKLLVFPRKFTSFGTVLFGSGGQNR